MADAPADVLADAARRRLTLNSGAGLQRQRLNSDYNINSGRQQIQYAQDQRDTNDSYAARGTFNSGLRVDSQGRLTRDFAQKSYDMGQARQRGLQDVDLGVQSGMNDIQSMQDAGAREETNRQLQQQLAQQQNQMQQSYYGQQLQGQNDYYNQALQQQQSQIDEQNRQNFLAAVAYGNAQKNKQQKLPTLWG